MFHKYYHIYTYEAFSWGLNTFFSLSFDWNVELFLWHDDVMIQLIYSMRVISKGMKTLHPMEIKDTPSASHQSSYCYF